MLLAIQRRATSFTFILLCLSAIVRGEDYLTEFDDVVPGPKKFHDEPGNQRNYDSTGPPHVDEAEILPKKFGDVPDHQRNYDLILTPNPSDSYSGGISSFGNTSKSTDGYTNDLETIETLPAIEKPKVQSGSCGDNAMATNRVSCAPGISPCQAAQSSGCGGNQSPPSGTSCGVTNTQSYRNENDVESCASTGSCGNANCGQQQYSMAVGLEFGRLYLKGLVPPVPTYEALFESLYATTLPSGADVCAACEALLSTADAVQLREANPHAVLSSIISLRDGWLRRWNVCRKWNGKFGDD